MNQNELYHSSVYYGQEVSDGLYHYKYIKRERGKNGKWRYYYKLKDIVDYNITGKGYKRDADELDKQASKINPYEHLDEYFKDDRKDFRTDLNKANELYKKASDQRRIYYYQNSLFGKIEKMYMNTPTFYQMKETGKKKLASWIEKYSEKAVKSLRNEK